MAFPVDNTLVNYTGGFGPRKPIKLTNGKYSASFHYGTDLAPEVKGTLLLVYAVGSATVHSVGKKSDAGNFIILRLSDNSLVRYCHLSSIGVRAGQSVSDGQAIGRMGATGNVTGVHLHLEWYPNGQLSTRVDAWPKIRNELNPTKNKNDNPVPTPAPTPPAKTPEQIEEEELMAQKDDIIKELSEKIESEIYTLTSRMRREARPEVIFISTGEDGTKYTFETTPYRAAVHPASGFVLALSSAGQVESMKQNYRIIASDSQPVGLTEHAFFGGIGDVLRGSGQIPRDLPDAEKREAARDLFDGLDE